MGLLDFLASIPTASNLKLELDKSRAETARAIAERDTALLKVVQLEARVAELTADNAKLEVRVQNLQKKPEPHSRTNKPGRAIMEYDPLRGW